MTTSHYPFNFYNTTFYKMWSVLTQWRWVKIGLFAMFILWCNGTLNATIFYPVVVTMVVLLASASFLDVIVPVTCPKLPSLPVEPLDLTMARDRKAITSEAVIGTPLRTNGCLVCGEGSGSGYCAEHINGDA